MTDGSPSPFRADTVDPNDELPEVDLRTLLGEMAALKSELRASTVETRQARQQADEAVAVARTAVDRAAQREEQLRNAASQERRKAVRVLVDVVDRLEAALRSLRAPVRRAWPWSRRPDPAIDGLRQGLELTLQGLHDKLANLGVRRVATAGQPFDPNRMEALRAEERPERPDGEVLEEIVSGWDDEAGPVRTAQVVVNRIIRS